MPPKDTRNTLVFANRAKQVLSFEMGLGAIAGTRKSEIQPGTFSVGKTITVNYIAVPMKTF